MGDGRPRAPTYGPPITILSAEFLGRIAFYTWFEADLSRPVVDWMELSEAERDTWRRVGQRVAKRIRDATERSHALGNYLPPPRCPAKRQDLRVSRPRGWASAGPVQREQRAPPGRQRR